MKKIVFALCLASVFSCSFAAVDNKKPQEGKKSARAKRMEKMSEAERIAYYKNMAWWNLVRDTSSICRNAERDVENIKSVFIDVENKTLHVVYNDGRKREHKFEYVPFHR